MSSEDTGSARTTIEAWRARGDHRFDRVRFRFIEALAGRAEAHHGAARRILDDRLASLLAAYGDDLQKARVIEDDGGGGVAGQRALPRRGALAELVDHLARHASTEGKETAAAAAGADLGSPLPELKTLRLFKSTWSRLAADRWLTQALTKMPKNAGPLNSHHLMHRSLALMREVSPDYLNRFMARVDALSWVDQVEAEGASAGTNPPRAARARKPARGKSG